MFAQVFEDIRYQTRFVVHVSMRDLPKRVASGLMMMLILAWQGRPGTALLLTLVIGAYELAMLVSNRHLQRRKDDVSDRIVIWIWFLNWSSTLPYLAPAVYLAQEGSSAMLLAGFLWLFGIYVHITNTFAPFPFYNWSLMIPSFGVGFLLFWGADGHQFYASTRTEWVVTAGLMMVYVFNTFETLTKQKDTQKALDLAREEANTRLKALQYLSDHDSLTGLLNRRAFDTRLAVMLGQRRSRSEVAVIMLDLDGFKPINDTYTHAAGDQVLQTLAARLQDLAQDGAIVARLGGDEFALAFPRVKTDRAAYRLGRRVRLAIEAPVPYAQLVLSVGASVGVSLSSNRANTVKGLCSAADQAMYRAKSQAGSGVVLFQPNLFPPRPSLEDRRVLLAAFDSRQIRPHYQPKVRLDSGLTCGFEALARWEHPERGLLPPSEFLPQINQLGLQAEFLVHMTRAVLRDIETLIGEGLDPGQVSVNIPEVTLATLSGRQELDQLLTENPVGLQALTLEITEDVFITRAGEIIRDSIAHFRRRGLRVALDDFGTGFASFQHLRQLEFDELKIDASFVADLCTSPTTEVLVGGFLSMARGLNVQVIAEGVETPEQSVRLRALGCSLAQGFLFGQALPLSETRIRLYAEQGLIRGTAAQ